MDLNELHFRHQRALMDMVSLEGVERRVWAEECADYYANRIDRARERLGATKRLGDQTILKRILRA